MVENDIYDNKSKYETFRGNIKDILKTIQRGCELYVGVRTPVDGHYGGMTEDGKYHKSQHSERGFALATENGIPAILLDQYDERRICNFVDANQ